MDSTKDAAEMHLLRDYTTSVKFQSIYKQLWDHIQTQQFGSFKDLVEQNLNQNEESSRIDINYVYEDKTYLDEAIEKGLLDFVKFLLEKGANVNQLNKKKGPIHRATTIACDTNKFDVLDELLNVSTIDPNLQAEGQTALHIAVMENNLECARRLLKKGADPNICNNQNLTALHLAAKRKQEDMVNKIIEWSNLDLYLEYRDWEELSTREVLQKNFPDIRLPDSVKKRTVTVNDLKYDLNSCNETNFLKHLEEIEQEEVNRESTTLIESAVSMNLPNSVAALLAKTAGTKRDLKNAAIIALRKGLSSIIRQLLDADLNVSNDLLIKACIELGSPKFDNYGTAEERLECLKMILSKNVDIRCMDCKKSTPLHYAARMNCPGAVEELLKRGSHIGHMNAFNEPPIADIPVSILTKYFDDCIQGNMERANDYTIEFDYKCLIPDNFEICVESQERNVTFSDDGTREMDVFHYIVNNKNLNELLAHPLLSSFLYLKWHRVRHIFHLNMAFYLIFYVLLNAYIFCITYMKENTKRDSTEMERGTEESFVYLLRIFTGIGLGLLALREFFQLILSPRNYIWNGENWIEVLLVIFGFITVIQGNVQIVVITILLSAWGLVILIGKHPRMSTSIEMFKTISLNFMLFFFFYAFLIFAFALAFFTLFNGEQDFTDPGNSLFKTLIMLTGEFEAGEIPFTAHPIFSHFIFVLFVFLIAIVLFNLLNGLAVSDTAEILRKAELVKLISRAEVLYHFENVACSTMYRWKFNPLKFLVGKVLVFPHYLRSGKLIVCPPDSFPVEKQSELKTWPTIKMDPDVIRQAKDILSNRCQKTDNEKLLSKLERRFDAIETILNDIKKNMENNVNR